MACRDDETTKKKSRIYKATNLVESENCIVASKQSVERNKIPGIRYLLDLFLFFSQITNMSHSSFFCWRSKTKYKIDTFDIILAVYIFFCSMISVLFSTSQSRRL